MGRLQNRRSARNAASVPAVAFAQGAEATAQITGVVRDSSGAVMPGVLVEVTSPALIEKTRIDDQQRRRTLPHHQFACRHLLGLVRARRLPAQQRNDIVLTSGFAATIDGTMTVGQRTRDRRRDGHYTDGGRLERASGHRVPGRRHPRAARPHRNVSSLLALTPGITSGYAPGTLSGICSRRRRCVLQPWRPGLQRRRPRLGPRANSPFNSTVQARSIPAGASSSGCDNSATNLKQGRVMVDGAVINAGGSVRDRRFDPAASSPTSPTHRRSTSRCRARWASRKPAAPRSTSSRAPAATGSPATINTTYTRQKWFDSNDGDYADLPASSADINSLYDYDVSGGFGGPIKRDHLWFYAVGRTQGKKAFPCRRRVLPEQVPKACGATTTSPTARSRA